MPDTPTVTRTPGSTAPNSSATASLIGNTVLEPSKRTLPDSPACSLPDVDSFRSAQAVTMRATAAINNIFFILQLLRTLHIELNRPNIKIM